MAGMPRVGVWVCAWACFGFLLPAHSSLSPMLRLKDQMKSLDEAGLTSMLMDAKLALIVHAQREFKHTPTHTSPLTEQSYLPVVQMHGMGDHATNRHGMVPLQEAISDYLNGTYVVNIQIGDNALEDVLNSFFMNLDDQVDYFAQVVASDPLLAQGFNAIGYSQGNLVIRGYVERYNSPKCYNFISMHGPMSGVAGFPSCDLSHDVCVAFDTLLATLAYNPLVQEHLAQANYYRFPTMIDEYLASDVFLADVNNERPESFKTEYGDRFASLHNLCAVKALGDTVVIPNESEWFGFFEEGSLENLLLMNETSWYMNDLYGLRRLDESGSLQPFTTSGDHLDFETDELLDLIDKCFTV